MNWRDHLTPTEKDDLLTFHTARDACRGEVEKFSQAIARIRNTCVNRARRASR